MDANNPEIVGAKVFDRAGRYEPTRLHAKGGLGEVYVAQDTELDRTVALKRIQPRRLSDPESQRRFLLEAKVTGRLEHPGIVPIYGLTRDADGAPCYAMRFIEGETLQEAIKRFHEGSDGSARSARDQRIEFRQLLTRFVTVCNTIAYAHSRGVVHRDLKPPNIMLGTFGETLVVDWGLAKTGMRNKGIDVGNDEPSARSAVCDESGTTLDRLETAPATPGNGTETGLAMGTPAFMSPEQATGDWDRVGPASDIYSLGATLYAILTGHPPFEGADVLNKVIKGEFVRPGQVRRNVPPALDAICVKAMAKRPEDRYAAATELAAEVDQWLADEPVKACIEPRSVRLARWGRRHKTAVASVGALCLTALVASLIATGLLARANENTRQERDRATEKEADSRAMFTYLKDALLAVARPEEKGGNVTIQAALDAASPKIDEIFAGRPEVEAEVRLTIGETYRRLGLYPQADPHLRRALDLYGDRFGPDDADTLMAVDHVATLLQQQGKLGEAETLFRQNLAAPQRVLGPKNPHTLAAVNNLALILWERGKPGEAEPLFRQSLEETRIARGADDDGTLTVMANLGLVLRAQGKRAEAESLFRQTLEARRRVLGNDHPQTLLSVNHLALILQDQGKPAEAEKLHRVNYEGSQRINGPDHPRTLLVLHNLAGTVRDQSKYKESEALYRQCLDARRRGLGSDHPDTLMTVNNLAQVFQLQGRVDEAEPLFRENLDVRRRVLGPDHADTLRSVNNLAGALRDQGKLDEAESFFRQNLENRRRIHGSDHPDTLWSMNTVALILQAQVKLAEAEALLRQVAEATRRVRGAAHPETLTMMNNLAALLQQQTKSTEAEALFREVLEQRRKILAEGHPQIADSLIGLGTALMESRKPHEAEPLLREGLDIRRRKLANGHVRISGAECVLGACLAELGRHSEAESLLIPAYESLDRAAGATAFEKRKALDYVVGLYESWKQPEKAAAWRAKREDSKKP